MNSQIRSLLHAPNSYEVLLQGKIIYWCRKQIEYVIWHDTYPDNLVRTVFQL